MARGFGVLALLIKAFGQGLGFGQGAKFVSILSRAFA